MTDKINASDSFELEFSLKDRTITVLGSGRSNWDVSVEYQKDDFEPTLDQDGGMFEPKYRLVMIAKPKKELLLDTPQKASSLSKDAAEIKKLFDFIKLNKENFFEKLGLKGVLEE
ncbi:hypothetical protein HPA24_03090 [Streptococcus suis]|nr:hypothetical protein [Streptococcus suis]NQM89380.1 hypothetical protein [Streptococcus suis]NQN08619.1 hypothetical protein [Streptococcus suis]NQN93845.1 hypothetical protein [Streptococcus suis]NQO05979.1 hypothetical protein [Streptococcus suis]